MRLDEFDYQIQRLNAVFGAYHPERHKIIWAEVKDFPLEEWRTIVDGFVGESRYQPTISEIRDKLSHVRERVYLNQKKIHAREAVEFMTIANDDHMRSSILKTILDRMEGKVPDEIWDQFTAGLNKLVTNTAPGT